MKLLFDQNLSRRLIVSLDLLFPNSAHVAFVGLDRAADSEVWAFAADNGFALISKDADFVEMARRLGPPPKVIHLDVGNRRTAAIEELVRSHHDDIVEFDGSAAGLLVISMPGPAS